MSELAEHELVPGTVVYTGRIPDHLLFDGAGFEELWNMHPEAFPEVRFADETRTAPRWHQAYGNDYEFAGFLSQARPVPRILYPLLEWTRSAIDPRLNGLLVNWYEGKLEHRIAPHKDSPIGRIPGCPIVTASFGAKRGFQMLVRKRRITFEVADGMLIVIPDATNRRFAHAVPHRPEDEGRRISVTLRGFETAGPSTTENMPGDAS